MSDEKKLPLDPPDEGSTKRIEEPTDPDDVPDVADEDVVLDEGEPDQADGEKE